MGEAIERRNTHTVAVLNVEGIESKDERRAIPLCTRYVRRAHCASGAILAVWATEFTIHKNCAHSFHTERRASVDPLTITSVELR